MRIEPDHPMLSYSGRIDFENKKTPVLVYAASYIKIVFEGSGISAEITNHRSCWTNYLGVILDGIQSKIALSNDREKKSYVLAENLEVGRHELLLFKRQDACHYFTFHGFDLAGNSQVYPVQTKPSRRIEVFGDSVSCGEVSEALDYVGKSDPEHDGQYSNSWYSYSWLTARALQAELHDTSQGGIALLDNTGWFHAPDYLGVESCYDKIQYNTELGAMKNWDFNRYQPHVVIVAIGQNDSHPIDYMAENYDSIQSEIWRTEYQKFIEKLMNLYPKAHIILQTTLLMHDHSWDRSIEEVCNRINDDRVHHMTYKRNGAGTPGHLRIPEAQEMAEELTAYINSLGEDVWT